MSSRVLTVLVVDSELPRTSAGGVDQRTGRRRPDITRLKVYIETGGPFPEGVNIVVPGDDLPVPGRYLLPAGCLKVAMRANQTSGYVNVNLQLDAFEPVRLVPLKDALDDLQAVMRAETAPARVPGPTPVRAAG